MQKYKDKLGNSGHITFRYIYDGEADADIEQGGDEPEEPETPVTNNIVYLASSNATDPWKYFSFAKGDFVE